MPGTDDPLLKVRDLTIGFGASDPIIEGVDFCVHRGQTLALVGESGSGKTLCCRALIKLLPRTARIDRGEALFHGTGVEHDLLSLSETAMLAVRGDRISMIFQEPMRSLSPVHRVGEQVAEVLRLHRGFGREEARQATLEKFARVGFPDPERAWRSYPFEMSGGMRQRAMIAMAVIAKPDLLIADEPTTALDVTTQAQVLGLIEDLQEETGMAVIFVTHDLGVVAHVADTVCVLRRGRVVERGTVEDVLEKPGHGYTRRLLEAAPAIPHEAQPHPPRRIEDPILKVSNLSRTFTTRSGRFWGRQVSFKAVRDVGFTIPRGETFALVGESGSGKSTVGNMALGALPPDPGSEILFWPEKGAEPWSVPELEGAHKKAFQRCAQMVFQDPFSSLSPRMRITDILTEPLEIHGIGTRAERRARAAELLEKVGLDPAMLWRYPHAFSGGQRQRLSIARALALDPALLVCDEPTSALDLSVQAQVLDLLEEIRDSMGLSYLFISHDLAVVARIADEVAVMRQGQIVEQAPPDVLFTEPRHPYTRALIAACLEPDTRHRVDLATVALGAGDPSTWPDGFRIVGDELPPLVETAPGHLVRMAA